MNFDKIIALHGNTIVAEYDCNTGVPITLYKLTNWTSAHTNPDDLNVDKNSLALAMERIKPLYVEKKIDRVKLDKIHRFLSLSLEYTKNKNVPIKLSRCD